MDMVADTAGFIVVYPDALNENWADGRNNPSDDAGVDDVGFISKMIDFVKTNYSIDVEKVFSCGMSNGAFMSHRLAVDLSDRIAAIGAVAGTMGNATFTRFPPQHPMPLIEFHGTSDTYVPYNGGAVVVTRGEARGVEEVVNSYAGFDGCDVTPVKTDIPNINKLDLSTVEKYTYTNCDNNADVVFFKIIRGGHTWPGGNRIIAFGSTNGDISASGEIWNFFRTKRRVGAPQLTAIEPTIKIFPNPVQHELQFEYIGTEEPLVLDKIGRTFAVKVLEVGNLKKIDISQLTPGEYFLKLGEKVERFWIR